MKASGPNDEQCIVTGAPVVLVEHDDGAWQWAATRLLEHAGYRVLTCPGPHQLPGGDCPLVAGGDCPLVENADVVVNGLRLNDPTSRAVLRAIHHRRPELPRLVEATPDDRQKGHVPQGCRVLNFPVTTAALQAEVAAAAPQPGRR